jgi:MFS family permease
MDPADKHTTTRRKRGVVAHDPRDRLRAQRCPWQPAHADPNQFALLRQRRFAPFFWTQFSGAANDNLFKFAFTVMVTYQLSVSWLPPAMAGLVIGALFILPFLLFSATSGQLTDKYDKTRMIRFVKNLEIAIMLLAAWGFMRQRAGAAGCTFLMGVHSTLFGPVKFAYMPQVLSERELTGGNGMVEMGTFVAILLGNVAGGLLVAMPGIGHTTWPWPVCCWRWPGGGCGAVHPPGAGHRPGPHHQLEPLHRDLAQPEAGARQHRGVPLAAGHQLDVVFWRGVFEPVPQLCQRGAAWQRAGGLAAAGGVFHRHRHRLAAVRGAERAAMSRSAWCRWAPSA